MACLKYLTHGNFPTNDLLIPIPISISGNVFHILDLTALWSGSIWHVQADNLED